MQLIFAYFMTRGASLGVMPVFAPSNSQGFLQGEMVFSPDELNATESKLANSSLEMLTHRVASMSRFLQFPHLMLVSKCFIRGMHNIRAYKQGRDAFCGNGWYSCQGYRNYHFWTWFSFGELNKILDQMRKSKRERACFFQRLHSTVDVVLADFIDRALRGNNQITFHEIWCAVVAASGPVDVTILITQDVVDQLKRYESMQRRDLQLTRLSKEDTDIVYTVSFGPRILEVSLVTNKCRELTPGGDLIRKRRRNLYENSS
jgi:hypothetical protein